MLFGVFLNMILYGVSAIFQDPNLQLVTRLQVLVVQVGAISQQSFIFNEAKFFHQQGVYLLAELQTVSFF
jgi:hypothetical protein